MKPGDKYPVNLNEHVVAEAVVVDIEDGKVTLDIPATRIVMGVKSSLTDLPDTAPEKEHILLDDKRPAAPEPKATDSNSPTQVSSNNAQGVSGAPVPVIDDSVGEGLANVKLQEME